MPQDGGKGCSQGVDIHAWLIALVNMLDRRKDQREMQSWCGGPALLGENCIHPSCIGEFPEACLLPEMLSVVVSQYKQLGKGICLSFRGRFVWQAHLKMRH